LVGGTGEVTRRRGLKESRLALLFRRSFSSVERLCESLLTRNLCDAEPRAGLLGRNRSGDLTELVDVVLELLSMTFNDGRRNIEVLGRRVGRVEAPREDFR
jgi:hypothetical protein